MRMNLARRIAEVSPATVQIFTTVLTQGPIARAEVARRTGLSGAAVTKAVRPLMEAGYLAEAGEPRPQPMGRPTRPLTVPADREYFAGVKVTADELIGVVTDLQAKVLVSRRVRVRDTRPDAVVAAIAALTADLLAEVPAERTFSLGLSAGGHVDRAAGVVRDSVFLGWRDVPLAEPVQAATGLHTVVENDLRALTVVEQWFGYGRLAPTFALVTVGDGIGAGLVVEGRLLTGAFGVAGELGHIPMEPEGPRCRCGARGCVETIAASTAILADLRAALGDPAVGLDGALERDDEAVATVLQRAGHVLGRALATLANLVGTELIVLSGERLDLYERTGVQHIYQEYLCGPAAGCRLVTKPRAFEEWARGAAAVAIGDLFQVN